MSVLKSPTALRTIGEVAEELGVATHVLRFWESKFSQIKPQKRRGRRYYRPQDIRTITQIKSLLYGQGYTIRGVQKFLATQPKMSFTDEVVIASSSPAAKKEEKVAKQTKETAKKVADAKTETPASEKKKTPAIVETTENLTPDMFETDLFGNLIVKKPPAAASQQQAPYLAPQKKKAAMPSSSTSDLFSDSEKEQLRDIYQSLKKSKEKLEEIA